MKMGASMSIMTRRRETSIEVMRGWIWRGFVLLTRWKKMMKGKERKGKERLKH